MRVVAPPSHPVKHKPSAGKSDPRLQYPGREKFEAFRERIKAKHSDAMWHQFRQVARSIFGSEAFVKIPGREFAALALKPADLRHLAAHPDQIREHLEKLKAAGTLDAPKGTTPAKSAAIYARTAKAVTEKPREVSFTVATVNDDFTDGKTNLPRVSKQADIVLAQETKKTKVDKDLSDKFGVHQNIHRVDQAGTSVVWNRNEAHRTDSGYALGVQPHGVKMENRWINWTDLKIDGQTVRMVSVHRPPKRYSHLWPEFDRHVAAFVKRYKGPIVIGMDANERNPQGLARATGLHWHAPKGSIDGFLTSSDIHVTNMRRLPKGSSDHEPVVGEFHLRPKR